MSVPPVCLKVDVDTHEGMRDGVPRLLAAFRRHAVRASFFLAVGPDRSGMALLQLLRSPRFLGKMLRTRAPALYGWRTILSGTLLPARPVAAAFPDLIRRIEDEGHEVAVHAWDHRAWQDGLDRFKGHRIRLHFERACEVLRRATGRDPAGVGAPAWTTTPLSLAIQDGFPFTYASDLRGAPPCRLRSPLGLHRLAQFPGTGACLEELLPRGIRGEIALAAALAGEVLAPVQPVRICTVHAEVEGGAFAGVLDRLLPRLGEAGQIRPMREVCPPLAASLPTRAWGRFRPRGRAFAVSTAT